MFPPLPRPELSRAIGTYPVRFEDLSQDGRVHFEPIVASINAAIWRPALGKSRLSHELHASGVRPVFTRLVLEVCTGRLELGESLTAEGTYELAHEPDGRGGARRLYLNMWTTIWAEPSKHRTERADIGRLFAEHQLTRPHAAPGERRVLSLPIDPPVPEAVYTPPALEELVADHPSRRWREPDAKPDLPEVQFGLSHTDVNQHVNSLVYPRLFGEAALRRFASLGASTKLLAARLHIAFRKPFFAGDAARIELRTYEHAESGEPGAVGSFRPASAAPGTRPSVYVDLGFAGPI